MSNYHESLDGLFKEISTNYYTQAKKIKAMDGDKEKADTVREKNLMYSLFTQTENSINKLKQKIDKIYEGANNSDDLSSLVFCIDYRNWQSTCDNEYKKLSSQLHSDKREIDKSLPKYKMCQNDKVTNIDNLKHIRKDGGYDVLDKNLSDGDYIAKVFDKDGKFKGLKVYADDSHVRTNPELTAQKLGLSKRAINLEENEYMDKQYNVYKWNNNTHEFNPIKRSGLLLDDNAMIIDMNA